ncbi:hypothetical protein [Streptomyces mirabilis]|uniref:hypothetical protein n=1 Tax=Streptomyces mirabilis TaxID=68239 RepID=UPI0036DC136A
MMTTSPGSSSFFKEVGRGLVVPDDGDVHASVRSTEGELFGHLSAHRDHDVGAVLAGHLADVPVGFRCFVAQFQHLAEDSDPAPLYGRARIES